MSGNTVMSYIGIGLFVLFILAFFIPSIDVLVRRLHDTGKSGWFYFIAFIPIVGAIILLVFLGKDSQPGTNQYGPNPKAAADSLSDSLIETV